MLVYEASVQLRFFLTIALQAVLLHRSSGLQRLIFQQKIIFYLWSLSIFHRLHS